MLTKTQLLRAKASEYMNEEQLEFFTHYLVNTKRQIKEDIAQARAEVQSSQRREVDEADQAYREEENRMRFRMVDRQMKLIPKISDALHRIDTGIFGYCEATGKKIGLKRLLVRPTATLCAEEKERLERREQNYRDE